MMMKRYTNLLNHTSSVFLRSFYSKTLYREVYQHWHGFGAAFLLLMVMLLLIPVIGTWNWRIQQIDVKSLFQTGSRSQNILAAIVTQLPEITIENGQASIQEEQPFYIYSPNKERIIGTIDTTGGTHSTLGTDAMFLITKHEMVILMETGQEIHYNFQPIQKKYVVNRQSIPEIFDNLKTFTRWFLPLIAYPILALSYTVLTFIQCLFLGLIGVLLLPILKLPCNLKEGTRLAVVAAIPALLIEMFFLLFPYYIKSHHNLIVFGLSLGYFLFACWSNAPGTNSYKKK